MQTPQRWHRCQPASESSAELSHLLKPQGPAHTLTWGVNAPPGTLTPDLPSALWQLVCLAPCPPPSVWTSGQRLHQDGEPPPSPEPGGCMGGESEAGPLLICVCCGGGERALPSSSQDSGNRRDKPWSPCPGAPAYCEIQGA